MQQAVSFYSLSSHPHTFWRCYPVTTAEMWARICFLRHLGTFTLIMPYRIYLGTFSAFVQQFKVRLVFPTCVKSILTNSYWIVGFYSRSRPQFQYAPKICPLSYFSLSYTHIFASCRHPYFGSPMLLASKQSLWVVKVGTSSQCIMKYLTTRLVWATLLTWSSFIP